MDQALDNRLDNRLDRKTTRRTRLLFAATVALAMALSPVFFLHELLIGALGLVGTGIATREREGRIARVATVVFAGLLAGSLPYLVLAALT
ncbi:MULTISPECIES: hypothetical protein [Streptomyces]|uniref:Uncharacterized protein n=2 Tax=Streptomyces TaxID=1883 RepID=A0A5N6AJ13_9ACTN|nr:MULTISPECIES: hypothetical protein [Streptomyces]KAB8167860.1 hypothetical protein FH607_007715 [Streptomyces mimosae]KAB8177492.1 hypothetical protein FH609_009705 [Streptomyces sp. 3MP-14]RMI38918.1 hypothetical protein EBN88_15965 [Streptomyces triticirhizae]